MAASLVCWHSYSYSEQVFGTTNNAAQAGYNWVMTNILPAQAGLTVNGVVYQYTTVKKEQDQMVVHVQNENPIDGGYTFRSSDDWSGIPGNTINKIVPVARIPIQYWGEGSIEVEGNGEVTDPFVFYSYQYDTCFDPQSNPDCPGYKVEVPDIPSVQIVDPLDDQFVQDEIDRDMMMRDEDEEERTRKEVAQDDEEKEEEIDLENVLGIVNRSLQTAEDTAKHNQQMALNQFSQGYFVQLPDTIYEETTTLKDSTLPRNKRGRRLEFTQQLLHQQLVKSQYKLGER